MCGGLSVFIKDLKSEKELARVGFEPRVFRARSERDNHYTTGPELKTSGKSVIINLRQSAFFFVFNVRGFEGSKDDTERMIKIGQDDNAKWTRPRTEPSHPCTPFELSKTPDISLTSHSGFRGRKHEQSTSCRLECSCWLYYRPAFAVWPYYGQASTVFGPSGQCGLSFLAFRQYGRDQLSRNYRGSAAAAQSRLSKFVRVVAGLDC